MNPRFYLLGLFQNFLKRMQNIEMHKTSNKFRFYPDRIYLSLNFLQWETLFCMLKTFFPGILKAYSVIMDRLFARGTQTCIRHVVPPGEHHEEN